MQPFDILCAQDIAIRIHIRSKNQVLDNCYFEVAHRFDGKVLVEGLCFTMVLDQQAFVDVMKEEEVESAEWIEDGHAAGVGQDGPDGRLRDDEDRKRYPGEQID